MHGCRITAGLFFAAAFFTGCVAEPGSGVRAATAWHDATLVSDFNYGIFCIPPKSDRKLAAPGTLLGDIDHYDQSPELAVRTQRIPAFERITFGVEGRERDATDAEVTISVDHPPLGSRRLTRESWKTQMVTDRVTFHAYHIGLSDGNPAGMWTITGTRQGQTLFRVEFEVVAPNPRDPTLADPCKTRPVS